MKFIFNDSQNGSSFMSKLTFSAIVSSVTLLLFTNYSFAESIDGVWSSEYGCSWLKQKTTNTVDNTKDIPVHLLGYLSPVGIDGLNWGCSFNKVDTASTGVINADSNCWMKTDFWKQNIVITRDSVGWVVTMYEDHSEKIYLVFDTQCVADE
jgi:hypothetical protein